MVALKDMVSKAFEKSANTISVTSFLFMAKRISSLTPIKAVSGGMPFTESRDAIVKKIICKCRKTNVQISKFELRNVLAL